jgi:3-oxoacyl-[acyl-carrier protein] reductase
MMLQDKVALVTGAGQGIGKEIALVLAGAGADIAVCDINLEAAENVVNEVKKMGRNAVAVKVDVSDSKSVEECTQKTLDTLKKIDILVNNAGITRDALLVRMKDEDWDLVLKINLTGTFNFTKAVGKYMMRQRSGKIVNIASIIGIIGNIGQTNYAASKAGIIGMTKSCARELAPRGITVNAVAPGFIKTAMTDKIPEDIKQMMLKNIPLNKFGTPQDVANTVLFLSGNQSDYITGQVINVCGGMVM